MTPSEIEKTIEFLLQNQAAAEARQDRTDAQIAELVEVNRTMARETSVRDRRLSGAMDKLTEGLETLRDSCRDLLDHARWTDARIGRLEGNEG